jgi:hypothetical protein
MTPYTVPAGSCVNDGTFTQGTVVRVAETLQTNAAVTGITVNANGVTTNIANPGTGIAPVTIGSGFTEVNFTNAATATLQVCKIAGSPNLVGRSFNVTVGSTTLAITAAAAIASSSPTNCVTFPGPFLAGQSVTVTEPTPGSGVVTTVSINGAAATTATTTGAFPLVAGANRVVFRNTQNSTLQLCKVAGTTNLVGTTFGFSVSGLGTTLTPSIRATTAGTCITIDGTLLAGTQVTITEPSPGTGVTTTISVNGAAAAAGTMRTFTLAPDANTVRFNNSRKHKDDDKGDNDKGDDDKGDDDGNGRDHGGDGKNGNDDNN